MDITDALNAWLDAPSGDEASNVALARALADALTPPAAHWILAIKPGGFAGENAGGAPLGYRARCRCRWVSAYYRSPDQARLVGSDHVNEAQRDAGR
jgi:hypothetical protein